jgi:sugar fermentation stimulation protein A
MSNRHHGSLTTRSDVVSIPIPGDFISARFERRFKRFVITARAKEKVVRAFLPHTGRLTELLTTGAKLILIKVPAQSSASLRYRVIAVWDGSKPVVVDTALPNKLIGCALELKAITGLPHYQEVRAEVPLLNRRIDFALIDQAQVAYLEVKSCSLSEHGVALFPDAPSERGTKQLKALIGAMRSGTKASVIFLATRPDVVGFRPNDEMDPTFGRVLRDAANKGLRVLAFTAYYENRRFCLGVPIQVTL